MLTRNIKSAGIAGVVAFVIYFIFAILLGDASAEESFLPSLLCGVATFVVALIITSVISSYYKNQRKH